MAKVKLNLKDLNNDETLALANTIKTSLTGNANFPTPNPTLAAFGTMITTAQTKAATRNGTKAADDLALADREASFVVLRNGITLLGAFVENASGGDKVKIESAGMSVKGDGAPLGVSEVMNLVVTAGDDDGTLDAGWDRDRGAKSYEIHTSVDPVTPSSWAYKMTSVKSSATIVGLTSGAKMWVRVRSIGAKNATGTWSDPAVKTVP